MGRPKSKSTLTISQRVNDWRKKTSVAYTIKFNKSTQSDVIEQLGKVDNKTQYIVDLIRADIEAKGGRVEKTITLSDLSNMMSDDEKARLEFVVGNGTPSVWHALKDEIKNDTRIVKEWHRDSDGLLCAKVKVR